MNTFDFVKRVQAIAAQKPTYREGGKGADGTCDCIGLIMGALGGKFELHSSNYFARCQMNTLDSLLDESQLHEGSVVYKSRRSTEKLHEHYQAGGRYFNGDLLDYYHVGVVTCIDPLVITHCTSTAIVNGIAYDNSIAGWSHFGDLLQVDDHSSDSEPVSMAQDGDLPTYDTLEEAMADKPAGPSYARYVRIVSANGQPVRIREKPKKGAVTKYSADVGQLYPYQREENGYYRILFAGKSRYVLKECGQLVKVRKG